MSISSDAEVFPGAAIVMTRVEADVFPEVEKRSKEEIQVIQSFKLPEFCPPYPALYHPQGTKARAESELWIVRHSIDKLYSPKTLQKLFDTDAAGLPLRVYVDAGDKEMSWICKYNIWMFALDDQLDDIGYFFSPEKSASLFLELNLILMWSFPDSPLLWQNLVEFLDVSSDENRESTLAYVDSKLLQARRFPDTVYDTSTLGPLCTSFRDLWATLVATMPAEFNLRWSLTFQRYLIGNVHETRNRDKRTIPSIEEYIPLRRNSVAMESCMVICEFADKVHLPDELYNSSELQQMIIAANDIVAWHNDIWSFKKEVLKGDVHNLVFLISQERKCSYAEAGAIALKMMLDRIEDLDRSISDLERITPLDHKHAVSRYVKTAQLWVSGTHQWHLNTKRYL